ncbi:MAG: peptide chain release factor 2 [Firmicutes bacterium]|jgi:peptide chain release factor 2|nr:peptide chain release factor 2 [Bacillota bacterium]
MQQRLERLEEAMGSPAFWNDQQEAQKTVREASLLKQRIENWNAVRAELEDVEVLFELAEEEDDFQAWQEVSEALHKLKAGVDRLELASLLNGQYDSANALLSIHPGAGGTESQDWAQMLLRMYTRWAEKQGYGVETLDFLPGEEAGIKSATVHIKGPNAYGYLQSEKGVHRLVRISPFDASGRRHTSFASVDVMPEIDDQGAIEIDPSDLRIDTFRSSGAGGQHVNKTESAVRVTHIPTGIVVSCQSERSQHANREAAMRVLRAKLLERKMEEQEAKLAEIRGEQREIAWGSQIRSYVFCPYTMVKDHRTEMEIGNVEAVMDGEIDPLIEAYLHWKARAQGQGALS